MSIPAYQGFTTIQTHPDNSHHLQDAYKDRKHPAKAAMGWLSDGSGSNLAQLPVPGGELVQLGGRRIGGSAMRRSTVGKPGLWIEAVEFCRSYEGVHRGSAFTAPVRCDLMMPGVWDTR